MPFRETTIADLAINNLGFGIDVTTHCNLNCLTCYYLESAENLPVCSDVHISMELFEKAIRQADQTGFQEIYILGGEPTLHPRILDLLQCAGRFHFRQVLLVTNGIRLKNPGFCRDIAATGTDIVVQRHVIGNGAAEQQIQDTVAGRKGTLTEVNQAFTNIEALFEPGRVAVQCCITRPVIETGQIYDVFRYAKTRRFEHVIECTKASDRFTRGNSSDLSPAELSQVYERLQRIDIEEFNGIPHPATPQAYGKTCHMPENSVHCLVDGTIVPCVGQPFPLGNLFTEPETSLADILSSPQRDFFRHPNRRMTGHCLDCGHIKACTGGCRGDAFFLTGCFNASAIQCPQLVKIGRTLCLADFTPADCGNCALKNHPMCGLKKGADELLSRYLGPLYRPRQAP